MTTRGKLARGEHQPEFEGHVQRWVKQLEPLSEGSKVKILKWVPTGDGHCDTCASAQQWHTDACKDTLQ